MRNQARFADSVGIFPEFLDAYGIVIIPTTGRYFQVPYGICLPQKVENLLVAGRCVAGDRISHAATRQMMCCAVTGQGAGTAAAVSVKQGKTCSRVDIPTVQQALEKQGVRILHNRHNRAFPNGGKQRSCITTVSFIKKKGGDS